MTPINEVLKELAVRYCAAFAEAQASEDDEVLTYMNGKMNALLNTAAALEEAGYDADTYSLDDLFYPYLYSLYGL